MRPNDSSAGLERLTWIPLPPAGEDDPRSPPSILKPEPSFAISCERVLEPAALPKYNRFV